MNYLIRRFADQVVHVPPGASGAEYTSKLESTLGAAMDRAKPDAILYNAGTDVLDGDPLGGLHVSAESVIQRDEVSISVEGVDPYEDWDEVTVGMDPNSLVSTCRRCGRWFSARL